MKILIFLSLLLYSRHEIIPISGIIYQLQYWQPTAIYSPMLCQTFTAKLPVRFSQPHGAYILHKSDLYFSFAPIISITACYFLLFRGIKIMPIIFFNVENGIRLYQQPWHKNIQATVQEFLLSTCLFLVALLPVT
jgi:hypothetical protein